MDEISDYERGFELGFAVGLYEGEGTFAAYLDNRRLRRYARLRIKMIDKEPLDHIQRALGGFVRGPETTPKESAKGFKPKYRWDISTINEVERVAHLLFPHLSPRRQAQFQTIFDLQAQNPTQVPAAKQFGQLVCPPQVISSARGYNRHRLLGIPACQICLDSAALWAKENRGKHPDRKANKAAYMKDYFVRNKAKIYVQQRAWASKNRAAKREAKRLLIETERRRLQKLADSSS